MQVFPKTKKKSISFEDINSDKKQNKMIHKHQIESLIKYSRIINRLRYNILLLCKKYITTKEYN